MAARILSAASGVPAVVFKPVSTFPITAVLVTAGEAAVPARSPANDSLPLTVAVASSKAVPSAPAGP